MSKSADDLSGSAPDNCPVALLLVDVINRLEFPKGDHFLRSALPAAYAASEHAVKGFTDTHRVDVEDVDQSPVSITLIQRMAVNTPFPKLPKARAETGPRPMIEPNKFVEAISHAAENPTRDHCVGIMAKVNADVAALLLGMAERIAAKLADKRRYEEPSRHPEGILHRASEETGVAGRTQATKRHAENSGTPRARLSPDFRRRIKEC